MLTFVRVEPFVVPKKSLTGENTERVDNACPVRHLRTAHGQSPVLRFGQQLYVYIQAGSARASRRAAAVL